MAHIDGLHVGAAEADFFCSLPVTPLRGEANACDDDAR